jgi:hypothetical protein
MAFSRKLRRVLLRGLVGAVAVAFIYSPSFSPTRRERLATSCDLRSIFCDEPTAGARNDMDQLPAA